MPRKPKLLFLHGRKANAQVSEMQAMVLELDTAANCSYVNAPHLVEKFSQDMPGDGLSWVGADGDLRPAFELVLKHCRDEGPFDGVYGFSQGCGIVAMLSDPGILESLSVHTPLWKFAICVCGSTSLLELPASPAVTPPIHVPSIHLLGEMDVLLPESKKLLAMFDRPTVLTHPWGHAVPLELSSYSNIAHTVRQFISKPEFL